MKKHQKDRRKQSRKSKIALVALCVIVLSAFSTMTTLAYLTDRSSVSNTFTVGLVDIELDEAAVNKDGTLIYENDGVTPVERVIQNEYHLIPGQTYIKDPTLKVVKNSEECYVRLMVTINKYAELKEVFGDDFLPENYVQGWDSTLWPCAAVKADDTNNTVTYEFRYHESVKPNGNDDEVLDALFDTFKCPTELDNEDLAKLAGLEINVEGHAIQKASFTDINADGSTADEAWAAFDAQWQSN